MTLSQQENELAVEIGFDKEVLEIIKRECQAKIQKLHLEQEVYLKDDELSYLNEVLPEHYFDFDQDIYGAYNYAGNLIIEGLSVIVPAQEDQRKIFYKLKHSLALKGYITIWADINTFVLFYFFYEFFMIFYIRTKLRNISGKTVYIFWQPCKLHTQATVTSKYNFKIAYCLPIY